MLALALPLVLCGACSALFYCALPFTASRGELIETNLVFGAVAGFGILFGAILVAQGVAAMRGRESITATRALPPPGIFALAFIGALALGSATLALQSLSVQLVAYLFAFLHFAAASAPAPGWLAFTARRGGSPAGLRAVIAALGWGAFGATIGAITIEVIVGIIIAAIAFIILSLTPDGATILAQLEREFEIARRAGDVTNLLHWIESPVVIAIALFYFALIVPIAEEALKTLALARMDAQRTQLRDAILWGVSAGAGFALVENVFNAGIVLDAWGAVILMRAGTVTIHIANGALMARGWYAARVERRWSRLGLWFAISVLNHALWNAAALSLSALGFNRAFGANILTSALIALLPMLALINVVCIIAASRK
ncbi:MAG: PrsW family intramembrane metalloprotease [Chloroflexi bacterium]|nr:PrsW family intramembrane metalloprotease [Chloroflexota bacterium]